MTATATNNEPWENLQVFGPNKDGEFQIVDSMMNIWDGESMRGFGPSKLYPSFSAAFTALPQARLWCEAAKVGRTAA